MKAMVVYDSAYGNTAQIARAIGDGLRSATGGTADVALYQVGDVQPDQLPDLDVLVVGSPTQRFRPTAATSDFLKYIPKNALAGVEVAAFDTRFTEEKIKSLGVVLSTFVNLFGYAARAIAGRLKRKGGHLVVPPEGFYVGDTEGPLLDGELERATDWARQILAQPSVVSRSTAKNRWGS